MISARLATLRCAVAAALFFAAGVASAQTHDPAAADSLFQAGRAAMSAHDFDQACAAFRESERLDPAAGTLFNLADCESKRGRIAESWSLFRQVLELLPASDERTGYAKRTMTELEPRLPKLTVTLRQGAPADAIVKRDEVVLGTASLGVSLPVDPGPHKLTVTAPGRRPFEVSVSLAEREAKEIEVQIGEPTPVEAPPPALLVPVSPPPAPSSSGVRTAGFVLIVGGAAGLVAGVVTGVVVLDDHATATSSCMQGICAKGSPGASAVQQGRSLAPLSTALLVGGPILAAGGLTLVLVGRPARPSVGASLEVGPTRATAALTGRF